MDALVDLDDSYLSPPWGKAGRALTLGLVSGASKLFMYFCTRTSIINHDRLLDSVLHRKPGQGLLTVSNHARCGNGGAVGAGG